MAKKANRGARPMRAQKLGDARGFSAVLGRLTRAGARPTYLVAGVVGVVDGPGVAACAASAARAALKILRRP